MLKKKNRLQSSELFQNVLSSHQRIYTKYFWLGYQDNDLSYSRVGIIVSKKVSKLATTRNKIKRRIRNIIRELLSEITNTRDIVIVAKPSIKELSFSELREILDNTFRKII